MIDIITTKLKLLDDDIRKVSDQLNQLLGAKSMCEILLKENTPAPIEEIIPVTSTEVTPIIT